METCEHAKRHRSMQSIQSSASGSASPLRPPAKRSRRDPQPESDTGTSSSAELTKDTGSDESCSPSFHASESMGDHAIQVNLMEVSHTAPPLRPDRGNLNSLPSFLCEADLQAPPPRPDRGNLNRLSSFVCEADLDAPSTSPEHCKDGNQRLDFPPRWESAEEISKTSRAITAQRPVSTYTAKDMDHIQLAAEYLEAMGYEEDAFSLYALLLKRLHQDCPQDKATFLQAIINYSRCVSTPGHCEIIQHHLRDQAQQLLEEVSSCLLYQFLIEMALAETYSRKFDRPGVKTHLRRARQLIQGDNGYDQVIKQLPQNSRGLDLVLYHSLRRACDPYAENLLPREDPKEFTSWEFDAHALERIPLYRVPGPFELRVGVMRNPCIRLCLEWCQQKLQQLKYVPGPWMEIVSLEKRAHKVRSTTAHRMFLFTCLWNIWVNESEASSSMSGADAWMSETHSRLGVNATELLMITCAQIVHESGPSQGLGTFRTELDLIYSLRRGVERLLRNFDEALARHFLKAFVEYRTLEEEEPQWLKDLRQRSRAGTMGQLEHALHTTFSQTQGFAAQLRRSTRRLSTQAAEVAKHMTMTSSIRSSDSSLLNFRKVKESMDERVRKLKEQPSMSSMSFGNSSRRSRFSFWTVSQLSQCMERTSLSLKSVGSVV